MTTFVTVVRTDGDATRAAELLNINQPSMSKRLAFLQHAGRILRRPWLERVGKTWHLTEEGRRVLPAVEELVHRYRLLTEAIEEERPAVVFGTGPGGAAGYVRQALIAFRERPPDRDLPGVGPAGDGPRRGGGQRLARPGVRPPGPDRDPGAGPPAAVRRGPVRRPAGPGRRAPRWRGSTSSRHSTERPFTPKTLTRFPLVLPEPDAGLRREFDRRCRDAGVADRLRVAVEVGPAPTALGYVRDGLGVGVLPRSAVNGHQDLTVKALPPKLSPTNTVRVICRKRAGTDDLDLTDQGADFLQAPAQAAAVAA